MLDFPQPFGPTIPVIEWSKLTIVLSLNDLKPCISSRLTRMLRFFSDFRSTVSTEVQNARIRSKPFGMKWLAYDPTKPGPTVGSYKIKILDKNGMSFCLNNFNFKQKILRKIVERSDFDAAPILHFHCEEPIEMDFGRSGHHLRQLRSCCTCLHAGKFR